MLLFLVVISRTDWVQEAKTISYKHKKNALIAQAGARRSASENEEEEEELGGDSSRGRSSTQGGTGSHWRELELRKQQEALLLDEADESEPWWDSLQESLGMGVGTRAGSGAVQSNHTNSSSSSSSDCTDPSSGNNSSSSSSPSSWWNRAKISSRDGENGLTTQSTVTERGVLEPARPGATNWMTGGLKLLGWPSAPSEYELVQTVTDSFCIEDDSEPE